MIKRRRHPSSFWNKSQNNKRILSCFISVSFSKFLLLCHEEEDAGAAYLKSCMRANERINMNKFTVIEQDDYMWIRCKL